MSQAMESSVKEMQAESLGSEINKGRHASHEVNNVIDFVFTEKNRFELKEKIENIEKSISGLDGNLKIIEKSISELE